MQYTHLGRSGLWGQPSLSGHDELRNGPMRADAHEFEARYRAMIAEGSRPPFDLED